MILLFFLFALLLSLPFFGPVVSHLKRSHSEFVVNESYTATDALADPCCWLGFFPLDHSSTNTADADTPSLLLHDFDSLRVYNSRQYVIRDALCSENLFINRTVHELRRSWTKGLTVRGFRNSCCSHHQLQGFNLCTLSKITITYCKTPARPPVKTYN